MAMRGVLDTELATQGCVLETGGTAVQSEQFRGMQGLLGLPRCTSHRYWTSVLGPLTPAFARPSFSVPISQVQLVGDGCTPLPSSAAILCVHGNVRHAVSVEDL